jgi:hypothetical protein
MDISRRLLLLAAAGALLVACGPSSAQIKAAREARYQGSRDELFLAVSNAVGRDQTIEKVDAEQGALLTRGRWYEPDGTYEDRALGKETVRPEDGAIFLAFLVTVVGAEPPYQVKVEPVVQQIRSGYSAHYQMKPDDPQMPGWVHGKIDDYQLELHARLKRWEIGAPAATPPAQ